MVRPIRRPHSGSIVAASLLSLILAAPTPPAAFGASTYVVTTSADETGSDCITADPCSLREAIEAANAAPGSDRIDFLLTDGLTIAPTAPLPAITEPVVIDGGTQPGWIDDGPIVEIDGSLLPTSSNGLNVVGDDVIIAGLVINRFIGGNAIRVQGANATLVGNYLGPDRDGTASFGVPAAGTAQRSGVDASGSGLKVGGLAATDRNVIAGNLAGIRLTGAGALIRGNYIGMNKAGEAPLPNTSGIIVSSSGNAVIGPGNTISGNTVLGVEILGVGGSTVVGNLIGLAVDGTTPAGNGTRGIRIVSNNNVVGGTAASDRNVIAASGQGIHIRQSGNQVLGNWIGLNEAGTEARGNSMGIQIEPVTGTGSNDNVISGNVISGNVEGVAINGSITGGIATGNQLFGNLIGTDPAGTSAIANTEGVLVAGSSTRIGGSGPGQGNVISGNDQAGIRIGGTLGQARIEGNRIGVGLNGAPVGNGSHGIHLANDANVVGARPVSYRNTIANNGGSGVIVADGVSNSIVGNYIRDNVGLGIDLGATGVTPNDDLDQDPGPNNLQNFPEITAAVSNGTDTRVSGTFHGVPNVGIIVDVYGSSSCDPSGHGEGGRFLGDFTLTTNNNGDVTFLDRIVSDATVGEVLTATATDMAAENTSEFSACIPVTGPPPPPNCTPSSVIPGARPADLSWDGANASTDPPFESDECIFLFEERPDFELPQDLRPAAPRTTNMAVTGPPTRLLPAGTQVSSFLLHADAEGPGSQPGAVLSGSWTFDEPILGVIMGRDLMVDTDPFVGLLGLTYEGTYLQRGIEFNTADVVRVSSTDPRTLELTFAFNTMDEIRVFTGVVEPPVCDASPTNPVVLANGPADLSRDGLDPSTDPAFESNECIYLFEEQQDVVIPTNLLPAAPKTTNMAVTGPPTRLLPAGTRLSSYLLHADSEGAGSQTGATLSGSWTFSEPILGVFMGRDRMVQTDSMAGLPGLTYEDAYLPRGLEFNTADVVRVSPSDPRTLEVTFAFNTMDEIRVFTGVLEQESVSAPVLAGGTVTTDDELDGASLAGADTIETTVTSPVAGTVSISESLATPGSLGGIGIYGFTVQISAPTATVASPLVIRFRLDAAVFDPLWSLSTLAVTRNGVRVANCTGSGATPDPCVESRSRYPDGDAEIVIRTSSASEWVIGRSAPTADAGGPYTVAEGSSVTLQGSADGEGPFVYQWIGDIARLSDPSVATPVISAPDDAALELTLEITDALGFSGRNDTTVTVNNALPQIGAVTGPVNPVVIGTAITTSVPFSDPGVLDTHSVSVDWGDGLNNLATVDQVLDNASAMHIYTQPGVYTITATVTDDDGGSATANYQFAVVYDPDGGFVTGGGWIESPAGAYRPDPASTGKATFGFVSRYKMGATVPEGQTSYQFHAAGFDFRSTVQDWLVVNESGTNAQFKGTGTVNATGTYKFMIWARDGSSDTFRIKVWQETTGGELVVYDNGFDQAVGGGSIIVHKGK